MKSYLKAIAAAIGATATWGVTALADNHVSAVEWFGLAAAVATVLGVYHIPNVTSDEESQEG